jgi:sporulation integral membrane protein YtvI
MISERSFLPLNPGVRKLSLLFGLFAALFLVFRYIFPLISPFLLGALLALAAEPIVRFFRNVCHFPQPLASAVGITMAFSLLALALMLILGFLFRELRTLTGILPDITGTLRSGMDSLSGWLLGIAGRAPEGMRPFLTRNVTQLFSDGSALLDRAVDFLLRLASGILSRVPGGALSLGTGIIASFMISAKFSGIQNFLLSRIPEKKLSRMGQLLRQLKTVIMGWLKAQLKLSGISFAVAVAGFFLLGIPHALLWGLLVALVDAFPILGTGTVLVPWSVVAFLQGDHLRAFGLLGLYGAATLLRTVLEPRLVGKHLGLDPLVTLFSLYVGFRLFGLPGMLLSPIIAITVIQLTETIQTKEAD